MSHFGPSGPGPYIKTEDDGQDFNFNLGGSSAVNFGSSFRNNSFGSLPNTSMMRGQAYGSNNMNTSWQDDELAELLDFDPNNDAQNQDQFFNLGQDSAANNTYHSLSVPAGRHNHLSDPYSHTPPGNPIQSPYATSFDPLQQYGGMHMLQQQQQHHLQNAPHARSPLNGLNQLGSSALSPGANRLAQLQLGTSDSSSLGIPMAKKPRSSSATHWELNRGPASSSIDDTPVSSPMSVPRAHKLESISETVHAPKRVGSKAQSLPAGAATREEQKKAKRRVAHNVVEQKRRDKINDRIQELSRLVPGHRLEDNKIKRQLAHTARAPTSGGTSMSPPTGRRASSIGAAGSATAAASLSAAAADERDKTKGNSLDGAVSWMRDLLWMLHRKLDQEALMAEALQRAGHTTLPYQISDDELRMRSELLSAFERADVASLEYSRKRGTALWVPGYTDQAGETLQDEGLPDTDAGASGLQAPQGPADDHGTPSDFLPAGLGSGSGDDSLFQYTPEPSHPPAHGHAAHDSHDGFTMDLT